MRLRYHFKYLANLSQLKYENNCTGLLTRPLACFISIHLVRMVVDSILPPAAWAMLNTDQMIIGAIPNADQMTIGKTHRRLQETILQRFFLCFL